MNEEKKWSIEILDNILTRLKDLENNQKEYQQWVRDLIFHLKWNCKIELINTSDLDIILGFERLLHRFDPKKDDALDALVHSHKIAIDKDIGSKEEDTVIYPDSLSTQEYKKGTMIEVERINNELGIIKGLSKEDQIKQLTKELREAYQKGAEASKYFTTRQFIEYLTDYIKNLEEKKSICLMNHKNLKEEHPIHSQFWWDKANVYSVIIKDLQQKIERLREP